MNILRHLIKACIDISKVLFLYSGLFLIALFLLFQIAIRWFTSWIWTEEWAQKFMPITMSQPYTFTTTQDGIRAMTIWDTSKKALLLIHWGFWWFRHWRAFSSIPDIYKDYYLIIPERPWFAKERRDLALWVEDEAQMYLPLIEGIDEVIIFGISYGASSGWYLCSISEQCSHFIWGAGVYFAEHHITYPWFRFIDNGIGRILLSHVFFITWRENLVKDAYMSEIEPLYSDFNKPTLLFHARDDSTVPYGNSEQLLETITSSQKKLIRTDGVRHQIQDAIPEMLFEELDEFVRE